MDLLRPHGKNGQVVSLRYVDDDLFVRAFIRKVGCELLAQEAGVRSYDAVFTGVIAGVPMEDMDPDLLLGSVSGDLPNCTFSYVKQKFLQTKRSLKMRTGGDPLDHIPSWVPLQDLIRLMAIYLNTHRVVTVYLAI
jgi:hypothetical protein